MANKRMFSLDIVESDAFLDMPISSQALYFHLGMYADDEGFVNPKKIMRMIGTSQDDLKVLIGKRFVLAFESGVVVIKHWLIHNTIRMDRFAPTNYKEEKDSLIIKENKAYSELATKWQPNDNQLATQVKLSEDNISKVKTSEVKPRKVLKDEFETTKYPKTDYTAVLNEYQRLKGIKLQEAEFLPPMREIKIMFKSSRTVEQIKETMSICEDNYEDWSMNTVRMKIADVIGGKLISKNKEKIRKEAITTNRKII